MNGFHKSGYEERFFDISTVLHALGTQWKHAVNDETAQSAANLYYRLKGQFITDYYSRGEGASK